MEFTFAALKYINETGDVKFRAPVWIVIALIFSEK